MFTAVGGLILGTSPMARYFDAHARGLSVFARILDCAAGGLRLSCWGGSVNPKYDCDGCGGPLVSGSRSRSHCPDLSCPKGALSHAAYERALVRYAQADEWDD